MIKQAVPALWHNMLTVVLQPGYQCRCRFLSADCVSSNLHMICGLKRLSLLGTILGLLFRPGIEAAGAFSLSQVFPQPKTINRIIGSVESSSVSGANHLAVLPRQALSLLRGFLARAMQLTWVFRYASSNRTVRWALLSLQPFTLNSKPTKGPVSQALSLRRLGDLACNALLGSCTGAGLGASKA